MFLCGDGTRRFESGAEKLPKNFFRSIDLGVDLPEHCVVPDHFFRQGGDRISEVGNGRKESWVRFGSAVRGLRHGANMRLYMVRRRSRWIGACLSHWLASVGSCRLLPDSRVGECSHPLLGGSVKEKLGAFESYSGDSRATRGSLSGLLAVRQ